jgi:DNA-directed RNA polymerase
MLNCALTHRLPFEERTKFVEDNLERMFACANDPLNGDKWWLEAEYPWQFLAGCMELRDVLHSPNPIEFASRMPIHQDGTCNGLQHYAALGRDVGGAAQVNLTPSDRPSDVYTGIANRVEEMVNRDAEKGDAIALLMKGNINRKLVKQTVMTNTYGVTKIGAIAQVRARMTENKDIVFSEKEYSQASVYITDRIFESYGGLFTAAQKIQNWV